MNADHALNALVAALRAYETVALTCPKANCPPLTHIAWQGLDHHHGRYLVWGALAIGAWHFLGRGPLARPPLLS